MIHIMRIRNIFTLFLILPLGVSFWFFGWALYWIGSKKLWVKPAKNNSLNGVTFRVLIPEKQNTE